MVPGGLSAGVLCKGALGVGGPLPSCLFSQAPRRVHPKPLPCMHVGIGLLMRIGNHVSCSSLAVGSMLMSKGKWIRRLRRPDDRGDSCGG